MTPAADAPPPDMAARLQKRAAALSYDLGDPHANPGLPRVLAAGQGAVAERIVDLAFAHGIPVREDADLARILAAVEPGTEIPPDAIMAVAEVLAHLYRLNHWLAAERAGTTPPPPGPDQA